MFGQGGNQSAKCFSWLILLAMSCFSWPPMAVGLDTMPWGSSGKYETQLGRSWAQKWCIVDDKKQQTWPKSDKTLLTSKPQTWCLSKWQLIYGQNWMIWIFWLVRSLVLVVQYPGRVKSSNISLGKSLRNLRSKAPPDPCRAKTDDEVGFYTARQVWCTRRVSMCQDKLQKMWVHFDYTTNVHVWHPPPHSRTSTAR